MTPVPSDAAAGTPGAGGAAAALAGWTVLLLAGAAFLHSVGGALAPPPLTEPGQLGRWLDQREPAEAAIAVVRLLALGTAWYLLAVTVAGAVARLAGARSLVRAADAVTVPGVRRLLTGALGVSLAAVVFTGASGAAVAEEPTGAPAASATAETMRRLPDAGTDDAGPAPGDGAEEAPVQQPAAGPPPTMRRLPSAGTAGGDPPASTPSSVTTGATIAPSAGDPPTTTTAAPPSPAPPSTTTAAPQSPAQPSAARPSVGAPPTSPPPGAGPSAPATTDQVPAPTERTWKVQPGDHFWSVAERVLAEAWHRSPTDAEVDPYWRAMVDANRAVLRDAGNPDLLFPDQVITIPAPPPIEPAGG